MSPDDVAVALTPFGQVDNRLERRYEGTGLGLPLTKAFIELHGGQLGFESARGAGTRVTVTFPIASGNVLAEAV
jgi:signal transduction histidine kinase